MLVIQKISVIILGSFLIAVGINLFLMPFKVLDGGVIGLALIINYLSGAKVGFVMVLCSIPIFWLAWFYYRSFFFNSLLGLLISSYLIDIMEPLYSQCSLFLQFSAFSSSVIGGTFIGTGIGMMLRFETSTGGTDLLAHFIAKQISWNVGIIILIIDGIIISIGGLLLSKETLLLSLLTITSGGIATSLCTLNMKEK